MKLLRKLGTRISKKGHLESWAIFKCPDCLQEVERQLSNGKRQESCGNHQHGESDTKLHGVWVSMKQRILNPKVHNYKDYGGRGITICNEWLEFIPFRDWALANGYKEDLQINRILNDGNYKLSNCEFIPQKENCRSRRGQKIKNIEMANEIRDLDKTGKYEQWELAIKYNVSQPTISLIINNKLWR